MIVEINYARQNSIELRLVVDLFCMSIFRRSWYRVEDKSRSLLSRLQHGYRRMFDRTGLRPGWTRVFGVSEQIKHSSTVRRTSPNIAYIILIYRLNLNTFFLFVSDLLDINTTSIGRLDLIIVDCLSFNCLLVILVPEWHEALDTTGR